MVLLIKTIKPHLCGHFGFTLPASTEFPAASLNLTNDPLVEERSLVSQSPGRWGWLALLSAKPQNASEVYLPLPLMVEED